MAIEPPSPERNVATPPRAATPQPTLAFESVIDLDMEGTSSLIQDLTRPDPPKDLEKENDGAKTPATPPQQPDPRAIPTASEKKKPAPKQPQQQQQQYQQQQQQKHQQQPPAKGSQLAIGKKNPAASASSTRGHEQLSQKISHARLASKVLPNLLTPNGKGLGQMAKFVKAWNDADFPAGPSLTAESLQGMENSFCKLKNRLEVSPTLLASSIYS